MGNPKADLILHPVRMRVLVALSGQQMTAQQLGRLLPDVPQTTLYRQLNYLVEQGILVVVEEHRVRGAVERVFALAGDGARLTPEDVASATAEDHLRYFSIFVTSLLSDFTRFVRAQPQMEGAVNEVAYTKGMVYLSDTELQQFREAMRDVLLPLFMNSLSADRRAYLLATIFFPAGDPAEGDPETHD